MKKLLIFSLLALSLAVFNSCGSDSDNDEGTTKTGTELCLAICDANDCLTGTSLDDCKAECTADKLAIEIATCETNCEKTLDPETCKADCESEANCTIKKVTDCVAKSEALDNCVLDCYELSSECSEENNCAASMDCSNEQSAFEDCKSNVVCD
ncbi:hypothetical protein JXR93_02680 [bacterium]|nr:hypothetical protein [bacterium]